MFAVEWNGACETYFPPYNFKEGEKFKGIDTEIVMLVMSKLGVPFSIKDESWEEVFNDLKSGKVDFGWQFVDNSARRHMFNLVGPIRYGLDIFVVRSNSKIENWNKLSDFKGMRVGVIKFYNYRHDFDSSKDFTKVEFLNMQLLLEGLLKGKVDFVIGDFNSMLYFANKFNFKDQIRFLPSSIRKAARYIAFAKKNKEKAKYFEKKLFEIIHSDEYKNIIKKYESN